MVLPLQILCITVAAAQATGEIRVTMAEAMRAAIHNPPPEYAPLAKQVGVQGDVVDELKISETGDVTEVHALQGNDLLSSSVVRTLKHWKFKPFNLKAGRREWRPTLDSPSSTEAIGASPAYSLPCDRSR